MEYVNRFLNQLIAQPIAKSYGKYLHLIEETVHTLQLIRVITNKLWYQAKRNRFSTSQKLLDFVQRRD